MKLPRLDPGATIGFALGALVAIVGFGPDFILGTKHFWSYPPTDFSSHLIGWREYLQEPWSSPLLVSKRLEQPDGLAIYLMDCLPLVAFFAKMVRGLVPDFLHTLFMNPLGAWQVVSYGLQGMFGALILRQLGHRDLRAQIAGAVTMLSMEFFITRFIHTALSSHFFILAALLLYLRAHGGKAKPRDALFWALLLGACVLVHAYLFVMCAAIFTATLVVTLARRQLRGVVIAVVASGAAIWFAMWFGGFFGEPLSHGGLWGFGHKSTDLLSFFVPQYSPFHPSRDNVMAMDLAHDELSEGYDYLGAGLLVLIPLLVVTAPRAIADTAKRHAALLVVLVLMAMFAISNRVSVAQHVVLEVPLPSAFDWFFRQLRSSGRFIWPLTYAGALYCVSLAYARFRTGWLALVPPLLVFVQFLDGMGNFFWVRSYTSRSETRFLDWEVVQPVVEAHEGVSFGPSFQCVTWDHPIIAGRQMEIEWMAATRGIGLGSVRSSRPLRDCLLDGAERLAEPIVPNRLYVELSPDVPRGEVVHYERRGVKCATFRGGFACSSKLATSIPAGLTPTTGDVDYTLGTTIEVGQTSAQRYLGIGWSYGEENHRWTSGPVSTIYLRTDAPVPAGAKLVLTAGGTVLERRPRSAMLVVVNGAVAAAVPLESDALTRRELALPESAVGERLLEIELWPSDPRTPKDVDGKGDERPLGAVVGTVAIASP